MTTGTRGTSTDRGPFKARRGFYLAGVSLLLCGIIGQGQSWWEIIFLLWSNFTGIFLTYRFNDHIDNDREFRLDLPTFLSNRLNLLVTLQFVLVLTPLSFVFLSPFRLAVLAVVGFWGFIYSVKIPLGGGRSLRLKHILGVKNALIGLCWAALILVGADQFADRSIQALFILAWLQILVGSALRDVSDAKQDALDGVRSLPVVLGVPRTMVFLWVGNVLSLVTFVAMSGWGWAMLTGLLAFFWRGMTLVQAQRQPGVPRWTQSMNLMTCSVLALSHGCLWILSTI